MRAKDIQTVLTACIQARQPVLLQGAPGIGKTDIISQATKDAGAELLTVYCSCSDPTDPKGMPATWKDADGNQQADFIPFNFLKKLIDASAPLVCFLDDVHGAPPAVQLAFMNLILARKTGDGTPISHHVTFIAAANRRQDKAGAAGMLEPFKSRFTTIIQLEVNHEDWVKWALSEGLPIELISYIRFRPAMLHDFKPSADLVNTPSPRTVANIGKVLAMNLPPALQFEVFTGTAGEAFSAEFTGFLRIWKTITPPDAIILNPDAANVPTTPDALFATCGALARKASATTADRIVKYARRLPVEFQVMLIRDCQHFEPQFCNSAAYIQWSSENADMLI